MDEIDEVLNIQQRQARKMIMRRYQNKIERAKELAQKRMAPDKNIKKRAYAEARQIVRKRFAGKKGAEYEKLGPSEKISIDRAIEKKQDLIKRIALRLIPRVKAAEQKRLQSFVKGHALMNTGAPEGHSKVNESFMLFAEKFDTESEKAKLDTGPNDGKTKTTKSKSQNPEIKYYNKFGEQTIDALDRKSEKSGIDIEILGEVYNRGLDAWNDHPKVTREQYAFARVNSFINKGKSYYSEDADLVEETVEEGKRGLWDNIHAKRKRIKAGSGERMRKPGSKGAPSAQDFKDASESVEIDEGVDKNHPIVKEYNALKKHDIKTLRNMISQHHKVVDTSEFKTKDHAVSHYLRQKHGNKKVDQAFGFNEETELDELSTPLLHSYLDKAKKTTPMQKPRKVRGSDPAEHNETERRRVQRNNYMKTAVKNISKKYAAEETQIDEISHYSVGYEDSLIGTFKTKKEAKAAHAEELRKNPHKNPMIHHNIQNKSGSWRHKQIKEEVELEESNNTPYIKPHIEKGSTKQSGWKASNKHGRVKYFGMDFKKSAEKHAGISEEVTVDESYFPANDIGARVAATRQAQEKSKAANHSLDHHIKNAMRGRYETESGKEVKGALLGDIHQHIKDWSNHSISKRDLEDHLDRKYKHEAGYSRMGWTRKGQNKRSRARFYHNNDSYVAEEVELDEGIKEKIKGAIRREKSKDLPLVQTRRDYATNKAGEAYEKGDTRKGNQYSAWAERDRKKAGDRSTNPTGKYRTKTADYANEEVELDEKLTAKTPMSTYIKDFQKSDAPQFKGKSLEKRRQMAIAAKLAKEDCDCSDERKKIENVDRPPATKGVRTKQGEIQKKIIDESKDLNESFNIALAAGVGVTLTAADLGMRAQGGFALHPSVIAEMEQRQIEEDAESALKKPVYMAPRRRQDGSYGPAKTVLRKTGKKIIDNTPQIDADTDPHDGQ